MVSSTHLPPPLMMDSTAFLGAADQHVVLELSHVLLRRSLF